MSTDLLDVNLLQRVDSFAQRQPYRVAEYGRRSWGHPLHSLCSYQGKMKPSLAHWIIRSFTDPSDVVVDPLAGVGTIPFEAALLGRRAIANDLSPLAATVAEAKINPPTQNDAFGALESLRMAMDEAELTPEDTAAADFGLNASVRDYFHPQTLDELLRARRVFLNGKLTDRGANFVWASLLHVLHGNRPYALSRNSHPITPFRPTGAFEYRGVIDRIGARIQRALATPLPESFIPGTGFQGDFRNVPTTVGGTRFADAIVTSPPFLGMRFDRPNWLRLWFCGWQESDFSQTSQQFLERQQTKTLDVYSDFYDMCDRSLTDNGIIIVHVGSGKSDRLVRVLRTLAEPRFRIVGETVEGVAELEQHGLSDKGGLTTAHHLLFLRRR